MKDFLLMFVLVCVLGYLSLFLGNFGLLLFAAAVIAAVFTILMKLWFCLEALTEQLDKLPEEKAGGDPA